MRARQRECVCVRTRESCCQAKQGRFSFFNTKMGTKLSKCIFANWWLGAIISWWQIWKDPLDISIKPCEKTPPQRYCALSVEWTTFCICHNVQFLWESPLSGCNDVLTVTMPLSPIPSDGRKYASQLTIGSCWLLTRFKLSAVNPINHKRPENED